MTKPYNLKSINEFTYSLKINGDYTNDVYYTIQQMLKSCHFDHETNTIFFSAEIVVPFKKYILDKKEKRLSHGECIKLIYYL
jgi:hypothetical protein